MCFAEVPRMLLTTVDVIFICSLMYNPKRTKPHIKAETASMPFAASSVVLAALMGVVAHATPPKPYLETKSAQLGTGHAHLAIGPTPKISNRKISEEWIRLNNRLAGRSASCVGAGHNGGRIGILKC